MNYPKIVIDTNNPDPTQAVNAFLWCLLKAKSLGMMPATEHLLAEHLLRKDASVMFYSNSGGVMSLVMDQESFDAFDEDEVFETVLRIVKRRSARKKAVEVTPPATPTDLPLLQDTGERDGR